MAVGLVLIALLLPGCGSDDKDSDSGDSGNGKSTDVLPPQIVRDSEIEAQDSGSPARALLKWWQAFQYGDAAGVISMTSETTVEDIGKKDLTELVKTRGQGLQGIEVIGATENGDSASVRAGLLVFQPEKPGDPPPDEPTASKPATFAMEKDGGDWLYADPVYLQPMLEGMKRAGQQQDRKKPRQGKNAASG